MNLFYMPQCDFPFIGGTGIKGLTRGMQPSHKVTRSLYWSVTKLEDPRWAWVEQVCEMWYFPLNTLTLLVGRQEWHLVCKKLFVGGDDLTKVLHVLRPVHTYAAQCYTRTSAAKYCTSYSSALRCAALELVSTNDVRCAELLVAAL